METINFKRTKLALAAFALIMFLLLCRVFYIQILCHDQLKAMATSQYAVAIEGLNSGQYYYFIAKEKEDSRLKTWVGILDGKQVENGSSAYYVFRTESFDTAINNNLKRKYNAYVIKGKSGDAAKAATLYLWADAKGSLFLGEKPKLGDGTNAQMVVSNASVLGSVGNTT